MPLKLKGKGRSEFKGERRFSDIPEPKPEPEFSKLCKDILAGFGMSKAKDFETLGVEKAFRISIRRESTDGMFKTDEAWLCVFLSSRYSLNDKHTQGIIQAAIAANVRYLLLAVFGDIDSEAEAELFERLADESINVILLDRVLAEILEVDYSGVKKSKSIEGHGGFSFARIRAYSRDIVKQAAWRPIYQTLSIQPARVIPLHQHNKDEALAESDLFRAMQGGSFLLLGEPGAGKTTSLMALMENLASSGGRIPVFLPLGRYQAMLLN